MEKVRYMISDAATITGVESHVLRYWEDELELSIPRNEMGHRYYTRENIQQFEKIKELKEQGYQLKSIRMILHNENVDVNSPSFAEKNELAAHGASDPVPEHGQIGAEERMQQFRELMSDIVGRAIAQNNEELSLVIGTEVQERVLKEMDYLMREQDAAAEERYKKLDQAIRGHLHKKKALFSKKESAGKDVTSVPLKEKKIISIEQPT